ncbi:hypothetical protein E3P86_02578 [Wallemia ichthyophaga]|uniref:PB1 domain-containing protein n=1 Tax=Wallemia ichthyophaga TaxID=245174 RepID=A0A4T0J7S3_WALIC|nr:hypothetical protein E3P86_02578 [Wallemia ichthyophaga]
MCTHFTYKISSNGYTRKQTQTQKLGYEEILQISAQLHSIPLKCIASLGWRDSDGDEITFNSDLELECVYQEQGRSISVWVNTNTQVASLESPVYAQHVSLAGISGEKTEMKNELNKLRETLTAPPPPTSTRPNAVYRAQQVLLPIQGPPGEG